MSIEPRVSQSVWPSVPSAWGF